MKDPLSTEQESYVSVPSELAAVFGAVIAAQGVVMKALTHLDLPENTRLALIDSAEKCQKLAQALLRKNP